MPAFPCLYKESWEEFKLKGSEGRAILCTSPRPDSKINSGKLWTQPLFITWLDLGHSFWTCQLTLSLTSLNSILWHWFTEFHEDISSKSNHFTLPLRLVNSQFLCLALFFHNFCTLQTNTLCLTVQVYHQTLPLFLNQNYVSCLVFSWLRGGWLLALAQQLHSYKDCSKGFLKNTFFWYMHV